MKSLSFIIIVICGFSLSCKNKDDVKLLGDVTQSIQQPPPPIDIAKLRSTATAAKTYCKTKNLNSEFYILIDLKRHSGLKRFFIWDFKKDTIANSFLVSHGCGSNPWAQDISKELAPVSNVEGSHASSVGKYIIKERGYSNWGINVNYALDGQEATNNKARARQIVLHSWEEVPEEEIFPDGTPEGWGCPAISNESMKIVDAKLKASDKKVLLWVIQ